MTATEPTPRDRLTAVEPLDRTAQVQVSHFQTPFKSPQLVLLELADEQWLKIRQRTYYRQQKWLAKLAQQLPLRQLDVAI